MAAVAGILAWTMLVRRRRRPQWPSRRSMSGGRSVVDDTIVAELVAIGLSAGLSFPAALDEAASSLDPGVAGDLHRLARSVRTGGISAVLEAHEGSLKDLALVAGRAQATGAPILAAVDAMVDRKLLEERSHRLGEAKRLPVRLAIPLALLILPGFVVLVTAPAVIVGLERLGG